LKSIKTCTKAKRKSTLPRRRVEKVAPAVSPSATVANTDPDDYEDDDDDDIPFQELIWLQIDANLKVRNS
jgi:hypothetical protein